MLTPVIVYFILFCYAPMYGAIIAFKDYSPLKGIWGSNWVGLSHFFDFFTSTYFRRVVGNTFIISLCDVIWGFPAPILLALLLNEIRGSAFKRIVQTASYMPHFISLVVVCGIIKNFVVTDGLFNDIVAFFGGTRVSMLQKPEMFRTIFVSTNIWQQIGWDSIIYVAALTGIDRQLYEAASIDGASRFKQTFYVTLPSLVPTIVVLLILRLGQILNVGFEKIILLYNESIYDTADVISSFVYRRGLQELDWSFSTAVGLFNSAVNCVFLIGANRATKMVSGLSLW
ncbi:MAG: ABC transporter permease subunit [Firmicutes bacterium]|nr:ABC transporter permease subunit [Bacillota bacterium]